MTMNESEIINKLPQTQGTKHLNLAERAKSWTDETLSEVVASAKVEELQWRVGARKWYGRILLLLLFSQNAFVIYLTLRAYGENKLAELSAVLGIFTTGTLVETAYIVRIIVTELFKDINYTDYEKK